jgi:hypothetical protein
MAFGNTRVMLVRAKLDSQRGGNPSAAADSSNDGSMPVRPAWVLRTIGNRLYRNSAAIAGSAPMPNSGIMNTNSASDGTVCRMPVRPNTSWPSRRRLAARMPSGTAIRIASDSEIPTSARCSSV